MGMLARKQGRGSPSRRFSRKAAIACLRYFGWNLGPGPPNNSWLRGPGGHMAQSIAGLLPGRSLATGRLSVLECLAAFHYRVFGPRRHRGTPRLANCSAVQVKRSPKFTWCWEPGATRFYALCVGYFRQQPHLADERGRGLRASRDAIGRQHGDGYFPFSSPCLQAKNSWCPLGK